AAPGSRTACPGRHLRRSPGRRGPRDSSDLPPNYSLLKSSVRSMLTTVRRSQVGETVNTVRLREPLDDRSTWSTTGQCPIEKAMAVVGSRSAMLIMRGAFYATTRYDDL